MKFPKFLLTAILMFFFTSCDSDHSSNSLIVGTSADNPPYEFIQDGKIVGLDIDIINAIAYHLGKKVVIKNLDFHGLLAALTNKNVDLVIAGLSVTPERKLRVDFSSTYTSATIAVLYRKKDAFVKPTDLTNKHIGAQLGTIWGQFAKDISNKFHAKIHSLSNNLMLVEELKAKNIDAVVLEEAQAKKFISNNPELTYFIVEDYSSEFAIALPPGSILKDSIDNTLKILDDEGTLEEIRKKWLESE